MGVMGFGGPWGIWPAGVGVDAEGTTPVKIT